MTMPLVILALCSILFAFVLTPAWPWLRAYLNGESTHVVFGSLIQPVILLSFVLGAAGIGFGWLTYRQAGESEPLARTQPGLFRFLENKMRVGELHERTIISFSRRSQRLTARHVR